MDPVAKAAISEIDAILAEYESVKASHTKTYFSEMDRETITYIKCPTEVASHVITLMANAVRRLSPSPVYGSTALALVDEDSTNHDKVINSLAGVLKALRSDLEAGRVSTFRERVHADLFSDFLEMAEHLLRDGMKDPAAVLAGGVLEEHLRKLSAKHRLATESVDSKGEKRPKKLDSLNAELQKAGVYGLNQQKLVTAWAGIRNDAAHAHYAKYSHEEVSHMILGIRGFMERYPA